MHKIKNPAVSGAFYPAEPGVLSKMVDEFYESVEWQGQPPKAIIAPHAGYIYSGIVAACAYKCLADMPYIKNIVLIGPSHFLPFSGIAYSDCDIFMTPLGEISVNEKLFTQTTSIPATQLINAAFTREHCLEVQLPFLQKILNDFTIMPLLVGAADKQTVATVLENLWGDDQTLIVISSDLSHYHDYQTAQQMDNATCQSIENLDADDIRDDAACGRVAIRGLLHLAKQKQMRVQKLIQINSGDTAGDKNRVVGYGAYHFFANGASES